MERSVGVMAGMDVMSVLGWVTPAVGQTPPVGDLFAPLTNLFNQAAASLSGAFGLAYATAALLVAGALIVADHRNGVRNALWVIIGSVILFFGGQIIRMIRG
jgi:type IV secretory pathway VirB2 component (pilin)